MSPGGTDVVRWSGSQPSVAAGDIGMDVATGRPAAFVGGVNSPLAVLSDIPGGVLSASLFSFTHTSGSASTGALGFTPAAAIYSCAVGAVSGSSTFAHTVGMSTGTGTLARATGVSQNVTGNGMGLANDDDAIGGLVLGGGAGPAQATAFATDLDVTAFGAGGITLTWSAALVGALHRGYLLVLG